MAVARPKLLFVTPRMAIPPVGGRALLSHLHRRCLAQILGEDLLVHEIDPTPVTGLGAMLGALGGRVDGVSRAAEQAVVERIGSEAVGRIFLNGSNLGRLARAIRKSHPSVEILTFFHNVEARFFLGSLRQQKRLRAAGILLANFAAERMAVRFSHRLLALSARDSDGLRRLYGRAATDILPMAMEDRFDPDDRLVESARPGRGEYALFVGGGFYANRAGILWFAEQIAPHVDLATIVVGHGLEDMRARLERPGKLVLQGAVDRLNDWYRDARIVIAPIFDGSGMKTKVAEALMFGKHIVGTAEAFSGYEEMIAQAGWRCDSKEEFVATLQAIAADPPPRFDPSLRRLYERHYSGDAATARLRQILG